MFSGQTLGALTSVQEGAGGWRQQMDSIVANQMVSQLDTDGDGSLSLSEIQNALGGSSGTTSAAAAGGTGSSSSTSATDGLAAAFAAVDANGDGQLSADELTNALGQMGQGQGGVHGHHGHHHHQGGGDIDALLGNGGGSTTGTTDPTATATGSGDPSKTSSAASTPSGATATNTVSTLDGLTTADVAQALQAFLNSLAQSQAANLNALAQPSNATSVTA